MPALVLLLLLSSAVTPPHYAAFGRYRTWALINLMDGKSEWLTLRPGLSPRELTVTADGRVVVFTSYAAEAGTYLLYSWDKDPGHAPRLIGDTRGYHASPAIDPNGDWIYFAHNPNAVGMPMSHTARAYAQIYRVHLDGSGLQSLTDEPGCHFSPIPTKNGAILFVHTQCHGHERSLVRMDLSGGSESELKLVGDATELVLSNDGRKAVYVVTKSGLNSIFELDLETGASTLVDRGGGTSGAEPRFGAGRQVYYVLNDSVWRSRAGRKQRIVSLQGGPR
jgi:Tol biopolymer transport system component